MTNQQRFAKVFQEINGIGWTNKMRIRLAGMILNQVPDFGAQDFDTFFYELDSKQKEEFLYQAERVL